MLNVEVAQLRDEVSKHQKSLATICTVIDNLATAGGSADLVIKAAVKIEKSEWNNSWNVGVSSY